MKIISKDGLNLGLFEINEVINNPQEQLKDIDFVLQNGSLWKVNKNNLLCSLSKLEKEKKDKILQDYFGVNEYLESKYTCYLLEENWKQFEFTKDQMLYVMKYFQDIYNEHKVEAAVVLMLNIEQKKWEILFVPQVDCGPASVNYLIPMREDQNWPSKQTRLYKDVFEDKKATALMERSYQRFMELLNDGYSVYGTIHSHCNFGAFHSGVDDADETNFDGVHITIGNVMSGWSFSSRVMIGGAEYDRDFSALFNFTEEELKDADISSIEIDPYHMDLMMPDVGSRTVTYFAHGNAGSNYGFMSDWKNENKTSLWDSDNDHTPNWWSSGYEQAACHEVKSADEDDDDDEREDHVFDEDEMVIVYDKEEKRYQYVTYVYYLNNRDKFPHNLYDRVDAKYFHRKQENTKKEKREKNKNQRMVILKDPRLNAIEKSAPFSITDKAFSQKLKRKAKKKG